MQDRLARLRSLSTRTSLSTSTRGEVLTPVNDRDDRRHESEDLRCRLRVGAKLDDADEEATATPSLTISGRSGSHGTSSRSVTRIGGAWCENVEGPACGLDVFEGWVRNSGDPLVWLSGFSCARKMALIDLRALTRWRYDQLNGAALASLEELCPRLGAPGRPNWWP